MRKISVWFPRWRILFRSLGFVWIRGLVNRVKVRGWIWFFGASLRIFIRIFTLIEILSLILMLLYAFPSSFAIFPSIPSLSPPSLSSLPSICPQLFSPYSSVSIYPYLQPSYLHFHPHSDPNWHSTLSLYFY